MKKTVLRSVIISSGLVAGTIVLQAQSAGGGGGAAAGGTAAGVGTSAAGAARAGAVSGARGTVVGAGSGVTTVPSAGRVQGGISAGVQGGGTATAAGGGLNTVGASSITTPAASQPVGGASVIGNSPNVAGGSVNGGSFISPAPTAAGQPVNAGGTLPGGGTVGQTVTVTALPPAVQGALRGYTANGMLGSVTQIQGLNGPIYRASVTQNGVPMELQIAPTGQVLSQTPLTGNAGVGSAGVVGNTAGAALNADAGIPFNALPPAVQSMLATQLGPNGQVETISRDNFANGTVYRVTALQNGVPTEMRFAANGALLSAAPLSGGASTSFFAGGAPILFDALPAAVQTAIRDQLGDARINGIVRQQGTNGVSYLVSYDQDGQPMRLLVGPDGRILGNTPLRGNTAIGAAGAATTGRAASTNSPARRNSTNSTSRVSMKLEDLPDPVSRALKDEAKYSEVRYINREQRVGGDIYTIGLRNESTVGELTISADGKVLNDTRRNLAELSVPKPLPAEDEVPTGIPFSEVPLAIQNAVKAYATASEIRSISLGLDRDGKTVYDVIFYNDGHRDRLIVAKDGTVKRMEENVSPVAETATTKKPASLAIGDLPPAARDTIQRQTENVRIQEIDTRKINNETVYRVTYQTNGTPVELLVAMDGTVVRPEGSALADHLNTPLPAPITKDEHQRIDVVTVTSPTIKPQEVAPASASGKPAALEKGSSNGEPARSSVPLSDVPPAVQSAAKEIAGQSQIHSISPHLKDSGMVYEISFGDPKQTVTVNKDGKRVENDKKI